MVKQIIAIVFIYICTTIAWMILGSTILHRTYAADETLKTRVNQLWGTEQTQMAPSFWYETTQKNTITTIKNKKIQTEIVTAIEKHALPIESSDLSAHLALEHRMKGLIWYATYKISFNGAYKISNPTDRKQRVYCSITLPTEQAIYDNLKVVAGNKEIVNVVPCRGVVTQSIDLEPSASSNYAISYESQGQNSWSYHFGLGISQVRNFSLKVTTDFNDIDFLSGTLSPTSKTKLDKGWNLTWNYLNLLTGYNIGIEMPKKLNPGPWVSEVTFFAPVSLFFFFFLLFMFTTIRGIKVHPMNYFFIGAAFFSFHLLMAYLVDHLALELSFLISALVSVFLVVSYMRLVVSARFALIEVGVSQLIFLVLFSYSFFFAQYTGLVITILCILTLFVMMQCTGRTDWQAVFKKESGAG